MSIDPAAPPTVGFCDNAGGSATESCDNDFIVCIDDGDVVGILVKLVVVIGAVEAIVVEVARDVVLSSSNSSAPSKFRMSDLSAWISAPKALGFAVLIVLISSLIPARRSNRESLTSFIVNSLSCG